MVVRRRTSLGGVADHRRRAVMSVVAEAHDLWNRGSDGFTGLRKSYPGHESSDQRCEDPPHQGPPAGRA